MCVGDRLPINRSSSTWRPSSYLLSARAFLILHEPANGACCVSRQSRWKSTGAKGEGERGAGLRALVTRSASGWNRTFGDRTPPESGGVRACADHGRRDIPAVACRSAADGSHTDVHFPARRARRSVRKTDSVRISNSPRPHERDRRLHMKECSTRSEGELDSMRRRRRLLMKESATRWEGVADCMSEQYPVMAESTVRISNSRDSLGRSRRLLSKESSFSS